MINTKVVVKKVGIIKTPNHLLRNDIESNFPLNPFRKSNRAQLWQIQDEVLALGLVLIPPIFEEFKSNEVITDLGLLGSEKI